MITLHAVTPPLPADADTEGLRDYTTEEVSVLYEETDDAPSLDRGAVLDHGLRISRLAEHRTLLPMRYGTAVDCMADLEELVSARAAAWRRRLALVEGHCELLVHVDLVSDDHRRPAASGSEYLRRRADVLHRQDRSLDELAALVGQWSREQRLLQDRRRLAVLGPRQDAAAVEAAVTAWAGDRGDVTVNVTGPWPPFSFCDEEDQ